VGRLKDGRAVDLLREGKPADWASFTKPISVWRQAPNHRWRKLYQRLLEDGQEPCRESFCRYFAKRWNQTHRGASLVVVLELYYMQELGSEASESDRFQQRILCVFVVQAE
jgi:hypothetical protein